MAEGSKARGQWAPPQANRANHQGLVPPPPPRGGGYIRTAVHHRRKGGTPPPPGLVQSAEGEGKRERIVAVVRSPCQEHDPADAHPSAHKSVLESANPRMDSERCASGCPWSTARATAPSPGRPTPGVVKQDKSSGGSVDTTKTRSDPQRVGMCSGERPVGAAKGTQSDTEALCHPPPPRNPPRITGLAPPPPSGPPPPTPTPTVNNEERPIVAFVDRGTASPPLPPPFGGGG